MEKRYTRERLNEIERQYDKLSSVFGTSSPDELVGRVRLLTTGSESEKVEALHQEAMVAKAKQEVLHDELLQHQRRLEVIRFEGEGSNPGFLLLTPRGDNVMDYGGDDEVVEVGDQCKRSAQKEQEAAERYRRVALILTDISIA